MSADCRRLWRPVIVCHSLSHAQQPAPPPATAGYADPTILDAGGDCPGGGGAGAVGREAVAGGGAIGPPGGQGGGARGGGRLVPFARELARAGLVVLTPALDDLADYRIDPRSVDELCDSVLYLGSRGD